MPKSTLVKGKKSSSKTSASKDAKKSSSRILGKKDGKRSSSPSARSKRAKSPDAKIATPKKSSSKTSASKDAKKSSSTKDGKRSSSPSARSKRAKSPDAEMATPKKRKDLWQMRSNESPASTDTTISKSTTGSEESPTSKSPTNTDRRTSREASSAVKKLLLEDSSKKSIPKLNKKDGKTEDVVELDLSDEDGSMVKKASFKKREKKKKSIKSKEVSTSVFAAEVKVKAKSGTKNSINLADKKDPVLAEDRKIKAKVSAGEVNLLSIDWSDRNELIHAIEDANPDMDDQLKKQLRKMTHEEAIVKFADAQQPRHLNVVFNTLAQSLGKKQNISIFDTRVKGMKALKELILLNLDELGMLMARRRIKE